MQGAYTIKQFCFDYKISRSFLHKLWKRGKGPRRYNVGGRVFISHEAAQEWQNAQEQAIAANQ